MNYNVLILSAGRRVELVHRFKRAAEKLNINSSVVAVDITNTAPALYFADTFSLISKISDDRYIDDIISVCNENDIKLIVPTIDTELKKLSHYRELIESKTDAKILVSDEKVVDICSDKTLTQLFFEDNGFGVPVQYTVSEVVEGKAKFPLFIKPKDGSSSVNVFKIDNEAHLQFFADYISDPIIQEFVSGTEYSVDVFCDFDSNPITVVPRIRLATRSGEVLKGRTCKDKAVIEDVLKVVDVLKPVGQVTIQCMKTDSGIKYIEINPRFGGGSPMSIDAGADSCENLYRLLMGEKLSYNENYSDSHTFIRFDSCIELDENMVPVK